MSTMVEKAAVFCGPLQGLLHLRLFVCPGIHQLCVEHNGEVISPQEFCKRANKANRRDWKASIRVFIVEDGEISSRNLRCMMESKTITFFNHDTTCSGRCSNRNTMHRPKVLATFSLLDENFFSDSPIQVDDDAEIVEDDGQIGLAQICDTWRGILDTEQFWHTIRKADMIEQVTKVVLDSVKAVCEKAGISEMSSQLLSQMVCILGIEEVIAKDLQEKLNKQSPDEDQPMEDTD